MKRKWSRLWAIMGLSLLALSAPSSAQNSKKDPIAEAQEKDVVLREQRMQKFMMAHELAELGRKQYAPEYVIAAGSLLRELSNLKDYKEMKKLDAPEIKGDGAILDAEFDVPSLAKQSDDLFSYAKEVGDDLKVDVKKLIDLSKMRADEDFRKLPEGERGVIGGPKKVARQIGGGQTHSLSFKLENKAPTHWCYQSDIPLHISVVRNDDDNAWFLGLSMHATRTFHPSFNPKAKVAPITIRISNPTKKAAKYHFVLQ